MRHFRLIAGIVGLGLFLGWKPASSDCAGFSTAAGFVSDPVPSCCRDTSGQCRCQRTAMSSEPPVAVVYRALRELREAERLLFAAGEEQAAAHVTDHLRTLQLRFQSPVAGPRHTEPHVHAVGVFDQSDGDTAIPIRVTDTSGPIVLVLSGFRSNHWTVEVSAGVQLDLVIAAGFERQEIDRLPEGVPVISYSKDAPGDGYAWAYGPDRTKWGALEDAVPGWTGGIPIRTALGVEHHRGTPFVIGPENQDWRLQDLQADLIP